MLTNALKLAYKILGPPSQRTVMLMNEYARADVADILDEACSDPYAGLLAHTLDDKVSELPRLERLKAKVQMVCLKRDRALANEILCQLGDGIIEDRRLNPEILDIIKYRYIMLSLLKRFDK